MKFGAGAPFGALPKIAFSDFAEPQTTLLQKLKM
jgi:hypothetical protein